MNKTTRNVLLLAVLPLLVLSGCEPNANDVGNSSNDNQADSNGGPNVPREVGGGGPPTGS